MTLTKADLRRDNEALKKALVEAYSLNHEDRCGPECKKADPRRCAVSRVARVIAEARDA